MFLDLPLQRLFIHHKLSFGDWWRPSYQNEQQKSKAILGQQLLSFLFVFLCVEWGGGIQVNIFMSSDFVKLKNSLKTWTPFFFLSALKLVLIIDFTWIFWQFNHEILTSRVKEIATTERSFGFHPSSRTVTGKVV